MSTTATPSRLNIAQEIERQQETRWAEMTLTKVEPPRDDYAYWVLNADGTCWGMPALDGIEPRPGDVVRLYPGGFGHAIHGQDLNGEPVFFKTERERDLDRAQLLADMERRDAERFAEQRDQLDAAYESLPAPFRARLDRFRAADPTFRFRDEAYESFILVEAAKIAEHIPDAGRIAELVAAGHEAQREAEAGFLADGHSGATHGAAWAFAERLLRGDEV